MFVCREMLTCAASVAAPRHIRRARRCIPRENFRRLMARSRRSCGPSSGSHIWQNARPARPGARCASARAPVKDVGAMLRAAAIISAGGDRSCSGSKPSCALGYRRRISSTRRRIFTDARRCWMRMVRYWRRWQARRRRAVKSQNDVPCASSSPYAHHP